jgi:dTDP-glucose 4,6-dehydratase
MDAIHRKHDPDAVVNFAAESHVDRSIDSPGEFIRTNILGVYTLLECCREHLGNLDRPRREGFRFLHVSTDEVYGSLGETGSFREDTPYAPNSPYAASKASGDHLVRAYRETFGVPALITNCSNNYGPFQFPEKLIPLMVLNALEGRPLPIYGDGGNVRDWLYVRDHCQGILTVLEKGGPGARYNLGGRCERTNLQVVETICSILEGFAPAAENAALRDAGVEAYLDLISFVEDRPGHDRRYAIDPGRIERELGWRAEHDFDAGMRSTIRWYLENREWCEEIQSGNYRRERLGLSGT